LHYLKRIEFALDDSIGVFQLLSQVFGAEFLLSVYDFVFLSLEVNLTEAKTVIANDII